MDSITSEYGQSSTIPPNVIQAGIDAAFENELPFGPTGSYAERWMLEIIKAVDRARSMGYIS
jgi:hypothetical protein